MINHRGVIDKKRLVEVFQQELEQTKSIDDSLMAVVREVLAAQEEKAMQAAWHRVRSMSGMPEEALKEKISAVIGLVAEEFSMPRESVIARGRLPIERSHIRFVAMALLRRLRLSMPEIARVVRVTNHTSVLCGLRFIEAHPAELARVDRLWADLSARWGISAKPYVSQTRRAA